ncbi:hypothetical protein RBE51_19890 [Pseudomonas taiwanensis]|nr:hypothetical protein [Pseudomonas taiwanensis]MDT8925055.1 hypothetical protein [Pseudomonas taiwanensis]
MKGEWLSIAFIVGLVAASSLVKAEVDAQAIGTAGRPVYWHNVQSGE